MRSRQSAGKHGQYIFKLLFCLWSWTVMSQHKKSIIVSIINLWSSWCYGRWSYYSPCSSFNNYPRSKITTRAKMIWYPWSRKKNGWIHSGHGRIHRFVWCTMIRVILDHWYWSRSCQRNTPQVCKNAVHKCENTASSKQIPFAKVDILSVKKNPWQLATASWSDTLKVGFHIQVQ